MQVSRVHELLSGAPRRALDIPDFAVTGWAGHSAFAYDLVRFTNPKVLVELGTHGGFSYFSFCHAVKDFSTGTKCHAVDTWKGDEHAGFYAAYIYSLVQTYNSAHFAEFSTLQRMTFDEANALFAPGSVDLLHIDGLHTYEAVKHDWDTWIPLVRPGGIVLFHDTAVRDRGFGVHRLWEELSARYPTFSFTHSAGLGVLCNGEVPADNPFLQVLFNGSDRERAALDAHYRMPSPLFMQVFWSRDGHFTEQLSQKFAWASSDETVLRMTIPAQKGPLHLRFDSVRLPGVVEIASIIVRPSGGGAPLLEMHSRTGWAGVSWSSEVLKAAESPVLKLLSLGARPKISLPTVEVPDAGSIECEVRIRVRLESAELVEAVMEHSSSGGAPGEQARPAAMKGARLEAIEQAVGKAVSHAGEPRVLDGLRNASRRVGFWLKRRVRRQDFPHHIEAPVDFGSAPRAGCFSGWVYSRRGGPCLAVRARIGSQSWMGTYFQIRSDVAAGHPEAGNASGFSIPYRIAGEGKCGVTFEALKADGSWVQFAHRTLTPATASVQPKSG